MVERRIEEAGLNSWPALQQLLFDGWLVRFAQGYTKRANSVTPLYPSFLPATEKIAWCERLYQEHHLPAIFRLLSYSEECLLLDELLAQRGYKVLDPSQVWTLKLSSWPPAEHKEIEVMAMQGWLPIYSQWSNRYVGLDHVHGQLLKQLASPALFAVRHRQGKTPVACGLGVLEYETFGLFDIVTDPAQRRNGHGTQLVMSMLDWGKQHGAQHAYLQVIETNLAAQQMYAKLGFQASYQYWYRALPL